jgi:hypothetical protein
VEAKDGVTQFRSLSLDEAARYMAHRCNMSVEKAKAHLDRAFREYAIVLISDRPPFENIQGWQGAEIDWENSAVVGGEPRVINGVHYTVRVNVFRQHLDEWIAQAAPASGRSHKISLDDASARIGEARFGVDWIGKLTERERWLIKRYVDRCHHKPSSILPSQITYVGPGGPFAPVNDPALAAEVERARDRLEQMNDQYDQVYDWLEERGFDTETRSIDLTQFERAFETALTAEDVPRRSQPIRELDLMLTTGAPGRPSKGMHLIRAEFDRRRGANECKPSLREEATELEEWFRNNYPKAQSVKRKTIENSIRTAYKQWAVDQRPTG